MDEHFFRSRMSGLQRLYDVLPGPLRSVAASVRGLALERVRYGGDANELLKQAEPRTRWNADAIKAYQLQRLQSVINSAIDNVPFYANYPRLQLRSPDDLHSLPVLTREDIRLHSLQFVSKLIPKSELLEVSTTGTTGGGISVYYTAHTMRRNWAFRLRQWAWAGVAPKTPRITLFGSRVTNPEQSTPPFWVYNAAERQTLLSIYNLSQASAPHYIKLLAKHQGAVLEGFPSVLGILADFILQSGETIQMRVVFCDGEPLYPSLREKIEEAFHAEVFNSYGNTELCGLIQDCGHHRMHLAFDYGFLEVLDENNRPVPPGEDGFLAWTSFVNDAMPLIRYRIGDRGATVPEACTCGISWPLVDPGITRESDLLTCPDGRILSPRALNQVLKGAASFRFCQFVQLAPDLMMVRAVAGSTEATNTLADVRSRVQSLVGEGMRVIAELTDEPIVRNGGKIPLVVRKVC